MAKRLLIIVVTSVVLIILTVCASVFLSAHNSQLKTNSSLLTQDECADSSSCTDIKHCSSLHNKTDALQQVVLFRCGDDSRLVCCPKLRGPQTNIVDKKSLLPSDECGRSISLRISGGQDAELGQFPWMAILGYGSQKSPEFRCGGTLINERYVLTAAHCMENGLPIFVRLGEYDLSREIDSEEGLEVDPHVDVPLEKVIRHKMYNTTSIKNDIALIRLSKNISYSTYIFPVCLPFEANLNYTDDMKFTIAGWGKKESVSTVGSSILQFATVPNVPIEDCNITHEIRVRPINELQICAGGLHDKDVCSGDSGGPLLHADTNNQGGAKQYQIGITSFGDVKCGGEIPSVYTKVSAYLDWILDNIEP